MARTRTGGGGPSGWLAAIFGIAFIFALALAVIFYTRIEKAEADALAARQALGEVASETDLAQPQARNAAAGSGTILRALLDENRALRSMVTPDLDLDLLALQESVSGQLSALATVAGRDMTGTPLLTAVDALRRNIEAREERITQLQSALASATAEASAAQQQLAERRAAYEQAQAQLKQQLDSTTADFDAYRQQNGQMEQTLTTQMTEARNQSAASLAELESQMAQHQQRITILQREIDILRGSDEGVEAPMIAHADGQIDSVIEGEQNVYINLGRRHQLVLGMTFEVFDHDALVRLEEDQDLRGKATLEVMSIGEVSSLARIVRQTRATKVSSGDQIVNLVYSPDATYKFYVYGQFNISGVGEPSVTDRQRVESMVRRWGGKLATELNFDVDFLVLGSEPPMPDSLGDGTIDPRLIQEHAQARREYDRYQELQAQARDMRIPILNQNRFLNLTGYYER